MMGSKCRDKREKEIRVSFCPQCKSRNVRYIFGFGNLFGVIPRMKCEDCGFGAATFPILVTNEKALRKSVAKMKARNKACRGRRSTGTIKKNTVKKIKKKKVVKKK